MDTLSNNKMGSKTRQKALSFFRNLPLKLIFEKSTKRIQLTTKYNALLNIC